MEDSAVVVDVVEELEVAVMVDEEDREVELVVLSMVGVEVWDVSGADVEREDVNDCDVAVDDVTSVVNVVAEGDGELVMLSTAVVEVGMDDVRLSVDVKDDETDSIEDMLVAVVELDISVTIDIGVVTKVTVPLDDADSVETVEGTVSVDG